MDAVHGVQPEDFVDSGAAALVHDTVTPEEAFAQDLRLVGDVLDGAGVEFMLWRGESRARPFIAIDARDRREAMDALAVAHGDVPLHGQGPEGAAVPLAARVGSEDRVVRVFRPRVTARAGFAYGAEYGVEIQFIHRGDNELELPACNALMRPTVPLSELRRTTVHSHGRDWPTVEGMWDELAGDITFDIDIVFSWVDGAHLEWQRERARRMASYVVGEGDDHEARYRQLDELKYALRSVHLFAPWVRKIFVVTDSPRPEWLAEHERVRVVRSEEFFRDPGNLPTYNSHAVESQLHHLPGLSEHFIYSNDDMFFGRPVHPSEFFTVGGVSRFIEAELRIGLGAPETHRSGFENAARVNRELLRSRFGQTITRHLEHAPTPLRISVLNELEATFPEEFARTAASAFRSATDISVTNSLYHYFALLTGRAVTNTDARVLYVDTTSRSCVHTLDELLASRDHDFFCLNDGSFPELSPQERASVVLSFLERYFPIAAPWERAVASK